MGTILNIKGRKISIHNDGQIFVDGKNTNLKQWQSDPKRYSNLHGQEQADVRGQTLETALMLRGFLPR
jgi:hypothetical protein